MAAIIPSDLSKECQTIDTRIYGQTMSQCSFGKSPRALVCEGTGVLLLCSTELRHVFLPAGSGGTIITIFNFQHMRFLLLWSANATFCLLHMSQLSPYN